MMKRCLFLALVLGLGIGATALSTPAAEKKVDAERVNKLIEQLGSGKFAEREEASKELEKIGVPALEALRKATKSDDLETRRRASELVDKLSKLEETTRVLTPTKIRLAYKDTPVTEAVADIAKKTGFQIMLVGDTSKLADRKVTIDTGETTFWQAFDQFCEKAGLVEAGAESRPIPVDPRPRPLPAIRGGGQAVPAQPNPPAKDAPAKPKQAQAQKKEAPPPPQIQVVEVKAGVAVKLAQVAQVQVAQAPGAAPVQVQMARLVRPGYRPNNVNLIMLMDGKPDKQPTYYSGAVRIRALPPNTQAPGVATKQGEKLLLLEASPEPKLQWQHVQGVRIEKAIDDQGQSLEQVMAGDQPHVADGVEILGGGVGGQIIFNKVMADSAFRPAANPRTIPVRLKAGEKAAKSLKEINGTISAQVRTPPQTLMTVENLMKAAGKTAKGKEGGSIKVIDIKREDDLVKLQVELELPPNIISGNAMMEEFAIPVMAAPAAIQLVPVQPAPPPAAAPKKETQAPKEKDKEKAKEEKAKEEKAKEKDKAKTEAAAAVGAPVAAQAAPPAPAAAQPVQALQAIGFARRSGFGANFNGLSMVDAKGQGYQLVGVQSQAQSDGKTIKYQYTLTYKMAKDQGDPSKLTFSGTKLATVEVPFKLKDVPLP